MPTTSTTSLYDSDDRVFYPFTTENAYINPYSSDRIGGELITEYNQRNALNTICKKDMNYKEYAEFLKTHLDALFGDEVIVDDDTYAELYDIDGADYACYSVVYELKDGVKNSKFEIGINDKVIARNPRAIVSPMSIEFTNEQRTFMSKIIAVSFIVVTLVIFLVVFLMLTNCITNYIKEHMKTLGALKAIGYTSGNIRSSLLVLFGSCALLGALIGIVLSYAIMPYIASFAIAQMGIPYEVSFNAFTSGISLGTIVFFTCIVTMLAVIKVKRIEPIVALREGTESHNFRWYSFPVN